MPPETLPAGALLTSTTRRYRVVRALSVQAYHIDYQTEDERLPGHPLALREFAPSGLCERAGVELKKLEPVFDDLLSLFLQETDLLRALRSPHIAPAFDAFEQNGTAYTVSPPLSGAATLRELLASGPLPWPRVERIARQLLDALRSLHELGGVHGDLCPENILISSDPSGHLTLPHLGLPRMLARAAGVTPKPSAYDPPSLAMDGEEPLPLGPAADLYAWGMIVVEAAIGHPEGRPWLASERQAMDSDPYRYTRDGLTRAGAPSAWGVGVLQCIDPQVVGIPRSTKALLDTLDRDLRPRKGSVGVTTFEQAWAACHVPLPWPAGVHLWGYGGADECDRLLPRLAELHINELGLINVPLDEARIDALAGAIKAAGLTSLVLHGYLDRPGILAHLLGRPHLAGLTSLSLQDPIGGEGLRALARCPHLAHLRALKLSGCGLTDEGFRELAFSPHLTGLRSLDLSRNPGMASGAMEALFTGPTLLRLTSLDLSGNRLGVSMVSSLTLHFPRSVEGLRLSSCHLGEDTAAIEALAPALRTLGSLDLSWNDIHARGAAALSRLPSGVEALDLGRNELGDEGALALARSPHLPRLTLLHLDSCNIGDRAVEALAQRQPGLTSLTLGYNRVTAAGARALASSPHLGGLRKLSLAGNDLGPEGVKFLADSPAMGNLAELSLRGVSPGSEGLQALASSPYLARLQKLDLGDNELSTDDLGALARSHNLAGVTALSLDSNGVTPEGLRALAESPHLSRLTSLSLYWGSGLGLRDVERLLRSGAAPGLSHLELDHLAAHEKNSLKQAFPGVTFEYPVRA